jgi:hypothetical protein
VAIIILVWCAYVGFLKSPPEKQATRAVSGNKQIHASEIGTKYGVYWDNEGKIPPYTTFVTKKIAQEKPTYSLTSISYPNTKLLKKNKEQVLNNLTGEDGKVFYGDATIKRVEKYPDLAGTFMDGENDIGKVDSVDVDSNGQMERLVTVGLFGGNHCCQSVSVIKNGKIVASLNNLGMAAGLGVIHTEGNTFTVQWTDDGSFEYERGAPQGLCCPLYHLETVFTMRNGKLIALSEKKVLHELVEVIE